MDDLAHLRPLERRVTRLAADGIVPEEIGRRFNRSGDFVERVLALASLPGRRAPQPAPGLRPIERRLLRWREQGASPMELADRFRRGPRYIERVLEFADFKQRRAAEAGGR
jgi:DNA-binding CsgD family transcriptional regulator